MNDLSRRRIISVYLFVFMAAFAMTHTMFGILLPQIIDSYSLSISQAGLLTLFMSMGGLTAMLITGLIGDYGAKNRIAGIAFLALALSMSLIGSLPSFFLLVTGVTVVGMCSSMLNLIISAYISDLYGDKRTRYMSLLHVFFGVGSLLGPLYPVLINRVGLSWNQTYRILSLLFILIVLSYFAVIAAVRPPDIDNLHQDSRVRRKLPVSRMIRYPGMLMLCLMSFLYMGGHQAAFSVWLPTYLNRQDAGIYTLAFTGTIMTIYWLGIVGGRLLSSVFSERFSARAFITAGALIGTLIQIIALLAGLPWLWPAAVIILGLATGAIYPLTLAIGCEWFPQNSASVSSFVGIFSSLGNLFWLWLVAQVAEFLSFTLAMIIPIFSLAAVLTISAFAFSGQKEVEADPQGRAEQAVVDEA